MKNEDEFPNNEDNRSRNVVRGLGSLTLQNLTTGALGFVFLAVLLRLVSSSDYTAFSAVLVSAGIAVTVAMFGLPTAAARFIPFYQSQDEALAWGAAKSIIILSLVFSGLAALAFAVISPFLATFFMRSSSWTSLFMLGSVYVFTYSFSSVLQSVIQGLRKYTLLAKMIVVSRIIMVSLTVVGLELYHAVMIAVIAWIVYYLLLILFSSRIAWGSMSAMVNFGSLNRKIIRYCYPLAIAGILAVLTTNGDLIIVGRYTASLGIYNAVVQISSVLSAVTVTPLLTALLPEASFSSRSTTELANGVRLAIRFLILVLLPASFLLASVSKQVILLFSGGKGYLLGVGSLELIAISYVLVGVQSIIYYVLLATGQTMKALAVGVFSTVTDIGFSLLLVPKFGIFGGAVTRVVVGLVGLIIGIHFVRGYLKNLDEPVFYLKGLAISIIPFFVVFVLSSEVSSRIITLFPYSLVWAIVILISFRTFKIISDEDRNFIMHVLPSSMHKLLRYL